MTSVIKVDNIQHSSGTDAISIDSSGVVTQPAKPSFHVRLNTGTSSQNYTSLTDVPFDTIDHNVGSCVTVSSDVAEFTAPVNGVYHFNLTVGFDGASGAGHISTFLYIDDAAVDGAEKSYRNLEDPQGGDYHSCNSAFTIQLNANQTVNPKFQISTDTSVSVRPATRFSGFLVG